MKIFKISPTNIWGSNFREAEVRESGQSKTTSTKLAKAELFRKSGAASPRAKACRSLGDASDIDFCTKNLSIISWQYRCATRRFDIPVLELKNSEFLILLFRGSAIPFWGFKVLADPYFLLNAQTLIIFRRDQLSPGACF